MGATRLERNVAGTLLMAVNLFKRYITRSTRTDSEQPIFQCPICRCTYGPDSRSCDECWGDKLVRIG